MRSPKQAKAHVLSSPKACRLRSRGSRLWALSHHGVSESRALWGFLLKRSVHRSEGSDREEISKGSPSRSQAAKALKALYLRVFREDELGVFTALFLFGVRGFRP